MSLFAELRRRNVIRMAGLYLVGAWLVVQIAETLLPIFKTPDWVLQTMVVLLALGFIPALVFSWVFELTPDGLKRDREVLPDASIGAQTGRRMDKLILGGMVAVVALIAADRLWPEPSPMPVPAQTAAASLPGDASPAGAAASAEKQAADNSIAVLPFVNMSGEATNEYFSDGISEEILNVLASTPQLQVAARTSSFSFKGKNAEIVDIASALGVRMVLEGSVRKQGDQVRITAQLIDASTGFHVWSKTYDRKLEDIFAIQDEIAQAIGEQLKVTIGGGANAAGHGTTNLEAHDLYLRGIALWHGRDGDDMLEAITLFEQAAEADPNFPGAYAGLALVYAVLPSYNARYSWSESLARAEENAVRAIALDPALPEAYAALINSSQGRRNLATAQALADRAIALRPSFATAYQWRGNLELSRGELPQALVSLETAARLDPLSPVITENLAFALISLGRSQDAASLCSQLLETRPNYGACLQYVALAAILDGNPAAATPLLDRMSAAQNPGARHTGLVEALSGRGDKRAVAQRLVALPFNSMLVPGSDNALEDHVVAAMIMLLGEPELALDYLERIGGNLGNSADWAINMPVMDPVRCEPRFKAFVERLKSGDHRAAKMCEV
jgi:TolB-like protein/tetratricopeptide (TPR) repeat protein